MNLLKLIDVENTCKGQVYRCKINSFINAKNEYVYQERMLLQKRMTCSGCEQCGYIDEMFREWIIEGNPMVIQEAIHNAYYRLEVINESRDWESGEVNDWELAFIKIGGD